MWRIRIFSWFVLLTCPLVYGIAQISITENHSVKEKALKANTTSLVQGDLLMAEKKFSEAIAHYQQAIQKNPDKSAVLYKRLAQAYSTQGNTSTAISYIEQSLLAEFDTGILSEDAFDTIRNSPEFITTVKKYSPNFSFWSLLYFYVALIGFYTAIVLNFNKRIDVIARILMSVFIFIHSFFILNIFFNITNYQYVYPHSYLMSVMFSFLYGPLLYFYFKRSTQRYSFQVKDLLHLLPTVLFLFYIIPIYTMSAEDKLGLMIGRAIDGQVPTDSAHLYLIVLLKLSSLLVYAYLSRRLYMNAMRSKELSTSNKLWQRNIYFIHVSYVVVYALYGIVISSDISSGFFYHSQIFCMSAMVLFLGFSANIQPSVFSGILSLENNMFYKYEKSALTESFGRELKANLLNLFDTEKIYRDNEINLQSLSERLNTSRHNTSQVINEHFRMNFNELINAYRIREAKNILESDVNQNLNIIDIAYEVGFNNKATFNKAFKKNTQLTPSQYKRISVQQPKCKK